MIGTMVLVLMGCGAAVSLGCTPAGIGVPGVVGTALAFGLAVVAMAYAIGGISGCHINPAITLGVWLSGRMSGTVSRMGRPFLSARASPARMASSRYTFPGLCASEPSTAAQPVSPAIRQKASFG